MCFFEVYMTFLRQVPSQTIIKFVGQYFSWIMWSCTKSIWRIFCLFVCLFARNILHSGKKYHWPGNLKPTKNKLNFISYFFNNFTLFVLSDKNHFINKIKHTFYIHLNWYLFQNIETLWMGIGHKCRNRDKQREIEKWKFQNQWKKRENPLLKQIKI